MKNEYNAKIASPRAFSKINIANFGREILQILLWYRLFKRVDAVPGYLQWKVSISEPLKSMIRQAQISVLLTELQKLPLVDNGFRDLTVCALVHTIARHALSSDALWDYGRMESWKKEQQTHDALSFILF